MEKFDLSHCTVCPRECKADRYSSVGACGAGAVLSVSKIMIHHWEEPCISGKDNSARGSGAVFFGGCPLKCVFCQNKAISRNTAKTEEYTPHRLAEELKKLEEAGAYNINFVSPTHFIPQIIETLDIYKPKIPIIFNTGGYEKAESVEALRGYADIFLTDFKYGTPEFGKKYSAAADYYETAAKSLYVMLSVAGKPEFSVDGMLNRGVVVRHLILPGGRHDSVAALEKVAETVPATDVILSLMSQFTPDFVPPEIKELRRKITTFEYEYVRNAALKMGFSGYSQDIASVGAAYTPDF